MKTAVIYARYSSTNQTEQSIEGQVHVCQDFAKRNNIIIVDSYIDRAISGTTDERDSFQRMLKDSNNKKWNYVLVYKLDRFARNKYEAAIHRKHLKDNGIKLLSAMENIPETPEGVLIESLLEGMNQYFSEELAQKVSRGLHESRMKGHVIGDVSFGYIKENKMLKINEEEAIILKRIFEDYASGKTILQISRDFEKENITKGGHKFIPQTIRKMLKRKLYTGEYSVNGKVYDKIYPQIITKELFDKVQKRMDLTRYGCRKDNHEGSEKGYDPDPAAQISSCGAQKESLFHSIIYPIPFLVLIRSSMPIEARVLRSLVMFTDRVFSSTKQSVSHSLFISVSLDTTCPLFSISIASILFSFLESSTLSSPNVTVHDVLSSITPLCVNIPDWRMVKS